jgi:putative hydrolase of the HAD superfamily
VLVRAVIFDWGGTLTPWHDIDHPGLWQSICAPHYPAEHLDRAAALLAAEHELWLQAERDHRSATIFDAFVRAGVEPTEALIASYNSAWAEHTLIDPDAPDLLVALRERGIAIGVLSNTLWPRSWHDEVFRRDGVLHLLDAATYSSEIEWTKPHPQAFAAAMAAVGVDDPGSCVFVGDRPWDDIYGAQRAGMRAVLVPNSNVPSFPDVQPDAIIRRLSELPGVLDRWSAGDADRHAAADC